MKYSIVMLTTITLIGAFVLSGCDRPSDKVERAETSVIEAERDLEVAKTEVEADVRKYRAENSDRIAEYNRKIDEIKQRINNETDMEARARYQTRLERHEATHRDLKREMDNYNVSGRENWDSFKNSFSDRMDDLGDSLNDFFSNSTTNTSTNY
jgi:predicted  nucleic acid-binding Zn-ribbon protein